jgi:hypothetical protein
MKRKLSVLLTFTALVLLPVFLWADCTDLGEFTSWALKDSHTILFYRGNLLLAKVFLPDCEVKPNSTVRLTVSYVCSSDKILIDDKECSILTLQIVN